MIETGKSEMFNSFFRIRSCAPENRVILWLMEPLFQTLTDRQWGEFLRIAREQRNAISDKIKMKLHPANPTPGFERKDAMLTYTKNEPINHTAYYAVLHEKKYLGLLEQEVDGFYYFTPDRTNAGFWPSWILKDIAFKLEAINEAWNQTLDRELSRAPMPKGSKDNELHSYD